MFDQVHGRELPPMEQWSDALLKEAIACSVQFGVLVLGQGSVIGRLIDARRSARTATVRITWDPRGVLTGVDHPTDMRFISDIPYPANHFSLMRPDAANGPGDPARRAARRAISLARRETAQRDRGAGATGVARIAADDIAARRTTTDQARPALPVQVPEIAARGVPLRNLSPMRRRILRIRDS